MSLAEVEGLAGAPWEREIGGALDRIVVESEALAGNPLGDPTRRPLYVYRPPGIELGAEDAVPSVYVLQGWGGQVDSWLGRADMELTFIERLDAMFAVGECPPVIVVLVDGWTSVGGSQFINSAGIGRYMDYLCDEVVPFVDERYPTRDDRAHRGLSGKSSGGYGAMVVSMLRAEVFGGFVSHAGDALFEACYLPTFPGIARRMRDDFGGSFEMLRRRIVEAPTFDWGRFGEAFSMYAYARAYTPDPANPDEPFLPFDVATARLIDDVWARWLELDPVRMASAHAEALGGMRRIRLYAGKQDEWFLDLGAQAFSAELSRLGVDHTLELFDGGHGGWSYRYPDAIRELVEGLG